MGGWGRNPNVAPVLLISLGCEIVSVSRIHGEISKSKKQVKKIVIQKNGYRKSVYNGVKIARKLVKFTKESERENFDLSKLVISERVLEK